LDMGETMIYAAAFGLALACASTWISCAASRAEPNEVIKGAFADACHGRMQAATDKLSGLAAHDVVPILVVAMRESPEFQERLVRSWAYGVLGRTGAVTTDLGLEQLLEGLSEPEHAESAASCLGGARSTDYPRVVEHLTPLLGRPDVPDRTKTAAVKSLMILGSVARPSLPAITSLFSDSSSDRILRQWSSKAMLEIGGLDHVLDQFERADMVAKVFVLETATNYVVRQDRTSALEPSEEYRTVRERARTVILAGLDSPHREVRASSLQSIGPIFGLDWIVFRSDKEYDWNPVPRKALQVALIRESDPQLRTQIEDRLNFDLDAGAERILRDIERLKAEAGKPARTPQP